MDGVRRVQRHHFGGNPGSVESRRLVPRAMGQTMAEHMRAGKWNLVWDHMVVGNSMYQCYVGLIMFLTGSTDTFVTAANGWFGFWGGLVLIRHFHRVFPYARKDSPWLLLVIFCPSVIYWTTMNVKEALMYWSICQVFANSAPRQGSSFLIGIPMVLVGITVGSLLRPHIIIPWVAAVMAVGLFQRGNGLTRYWHCCCCPSSCIRFIRDGAGLIN